MADNFRRAAYALAQTLVNNSTYKPSQRPLAADLICSRVEYTDTGVKGAVNGELKPIREALAHWEMDDSAFAPFLTYSGNPYTKAHYNRSRALSLIEEASSFNDYSRVRVYFMAAIRDGLDPSLEQTRKDLGL